MALTGFAIGILLGMLVARYKENKSNKIYSEDKLVNIFSAPIIEKIDIKKLENDNEILIFFREFFRSNSEKEICLFAISKKDKEYLTKIKDKIVNSKELKKLNNLKLILSDNQFDQFINSQERILVASLDSIEFRDIEKLSKNLNLFNINLSGLIILEDI